MKSSLKVFINSFSENSVESLYSKRLQYLLSCKNHLIDINLVDVNLEISKALNGKFNFKNDEEEKLELTQTQKNKQLSQHISMREKLFKEFGLIKNSNNEEIRLPQAFLVIEASIFVIEPKNSGKVLDYSDEQGIQTKHRKENQVIQEHYYLGNYLTLQYLEDCGALDKILSGEICPHYRSFKGRAFFAFTKSIKENSAVETCTYCYIQNQLQKHKDAAKRKISSLPGWKDVILITNYQNQEDRKSHELCLFFERNHIPFRLIDPVNLLLSLTNQNLNQDLALIQELNLDISSLQGHKIFVHGFEFTLTNLIECSQKGILLNLINYLRCMVCLKKLVKNSSFQPYPSNREYLCLKCHKIVGKQLQGLVFNKVPNNQQEVKQTLTFIQKENNQNKENLDHIISKEEKKKIMNQSFFEQKITKKVQINLPLKAKEVKCQTPASSLMRQSMTGNPRNSLARMSFCLTQTQKDMSNE